MRRLTVDIVAERVYVVTAVAFVTLCTVESCKRRGVFVRFLAKKLLDFLGYLW